MGNLLQVVVRSFAGRSQQLLGLPMHAQKRESITPRLTINNLMTHGALDSFFELKELDWRLALHPRGTAEIVGPMSNRTVHGKLFFRASFNACDYNYHLCKGPRASRSPWACVSHPRSPNPQRVFSGQSDYRFPQTTGAHK